MKTNLSKQTILPGRYSILFEHLEFDSTLYLLFLAAIKERDIS